MVDLSTSLQPHRGARLGDTDVRPGSPGSALVLAATLAEKGCAPCAERHLLIAQRRGLQLPALTRALHQYPILKEVLVCWPSLMTGSPTANPVVPSADLAPPSHAASPRARSGAHWRDPAIAGPAGPVPPQYTSVAEKLTAIQAARAGRPSVDGPTFGIDSCTTPAESTDYGIPVSFYIGEMGWGTNAGCSCQCCFCNGCTYPPPPGCSGGACFYTGSASYVGYAYTSGYWGLIGPNCNASGMNMHDWGASQGNWAVTNWLHGTFANYIYSPVIFCDVESGFGGWPGSFADNAAVLDGFLDALRAQGLTPGVYINFRHVAGNDNWFANNYVPSQSFVFWPVGDIEGVPPCECTPCANCPTEATAENAWNNSVRHACFGGQGAVVWQYAPACSGCPGDFDYTTQDPSAFHPVGCS